MKMHDFEDVKSQYDHKHDKGSQWRRRAVPGGWVYWSETVTPLLSGGTMGVLHFSSECAVFVPDPTAEHVLNAKKEAL